MKSKYKYSLFHFEVEIKDNHNLRFAPTSFVKNKEKKTREMAANVKLFADRTMSASQKKNNNQRNKIG